MKNWQKDLDAQSSHAECASHEETLRVQGYLKESEFLSGAHCFSEKPDHNKIKPAGENFKDQPSVNLKRKQTPIATGVIDYFPLAIQAVANLSFVGNEQHNPGTPLHWDRSKSGDESDALMRHFIERGTIDTDGVRHSAKVAWRALALLQKELESDK